MRKIHGAMPDKLRFKNLIEFMITFVIIFSIISPKNAFGENIDLMQSWKLVKVTDEYVFFEDFNYNLHRMGLDGKDKVIINRSGNNKYRFYKDWIYYIQSGNRLDDLFRMRFDGSGKEFLFSDYKIEAFEVIREKVYYTGGKNENLKFFDISIKGENSILFDKFSRIHRSRGGDEREYIYVTQSNNGFFTDAERYRYRIDGEYSCQKFLDIKELKNESNPEIEDIWTIIYIEDNFIIYDSKDHDIYKYSFKTGKKEKIQAEKWYYHRIKDDDLIFYNEIEGRRINTDTLEMEEIEFKDIREIKYLLNARSNKEYEYSIDGYRRPISRKNLSNSEDNSIWRVNIDSPRYYNKAPGSWLKKEHSISYNNGDVKEINVIWENAFIESRNLGKNKVKGKIEGTEDEIEFEIVVGEINSIEELLKALIEGREKLYFGNDYVADYYNQCKKVIDRIITDDISDIQRELAIVDYVNDIDSIADIDFNVSNIKKEKRGPLQTAILLNMAGIETHLTGIDESYWNVVKIDGEYYNLLIWDITGFADFIYDIPKLSRGNIFRFNTSDDLLGVTENDTFQCSSNRFEDFNNLLEELRVNSNLIKLYETEKYIFYIEFGKNLYRVNKVDATVELLLEGRVE